VKNGKIVNGKAPEGNAQHKNTLMGKVLRLDVNNRDAGKQYAVPKDNPFAKGGGSPEISPMACAIPGDFLRPRRARELFLADVGQDSWEEVDIITKGGNYGWNIREGFDCFNPKDARKPPEQCPKVGAGGEPLIDPSSPTRTGAGGARIRK